MSVSGDKLWDSRARISKCFVGKGYSFVVALLSIIPAAMAYDKTRNVVDTQLLHEMRAMLFHGFDTNPEFGGDLFVGFALGNQLKHSFLTRGQAFAFSLS